MTQTVIPRPIAWVLSDNGNGSYNLAPFSFFNVITADPPIIMISVGWKDATTHKDTWINIQESSDFVVHIPTETDAKSMVATSQTLPHGVSEVDKLGLGLEAVSDQRLPRVVGPKVAYFCEKYSIQEIGQSRQGLILGKVNCMWFDDNIVQQHKGRLIIDPVKVNPLARLGGQGYSLLAEPFEIKRPQ